MGHIVEYIQPSLDSWHSLPVNMLLGIRNTRTKCTLLLKVRNFREIFLCAAITPIEGIVLRDVIGPKDYFLGEIIDVDKKKFDVIQSLKVLILSPRTGVILPKVKYIEVIRDDGFLKMYVTKNNKLLLTKI